MTPKEQLLELKRIMGWSQAQLAEKLQVSQPQISKYLAEEGGSEINPHLARSIDLLYRRLY